jgi:hypothetical protein
VRQEIMRFRELLNVMRGHLEYGEREYTKLFSVLSPEDIQGMKEKDVQWQLAEQLVSDVSSLSKAVGHMRFEARNLEHAFEELYDIIVTVEEA